MDSVAQKIEAKIETFERGWVFFADEFVGMGSSDSVRQALVRLCRSGKIVRVAQGIYCYPEIDEKLGLGAISPAPDKIAERVAKRSNARIAPSGEYALNVLGLSTQVPTNYVFLTDGPSRKVKMANGKDITLKRTAPKNVSFTNRLAMFVTAALKSLKRENVSKEDVSRIGSILRKEDKEAVFTDLKLMPVWIRNIVTEAYE